MNRPPPDIKAAKRAAAKRAALNALKRAQRTALRTGAKLSDWEGEFLGSVETRLQTFGRAFGDPEKGGPGEALSIRQRLKLKEITVKAKGEDGVGPRRGFGSKARRRPAEPSGPNGDD